MGTALHAARRLARVRRPRPRLRQERLVLRDVVAVVLYLVLLAVAARVGVPWPWLVGGAAIVVLPLFSGSFDSVGRFGLLAPAAFWGLAALGRDPRAHRLILCLSVPLLAAAMVTLPLRFP